MVAELAGISTATLDGKASPSVEGTSKRRRRPKWIQTATREPIYSVLDSDDIPESAKNLPPGALGKVVVISAVKSDSCQKSEPREQRELSYVWLSAGNRASPIPEVEDENTLYSVVRKPKKVRLPETSSSDSEEAIRPVNTTRIRDTGEKSIEQQQQQQQQQLDPEDASRRVEVRKWLCDSPRQPLPDPPKMYSDRCEYENPWCPPGGRENPVAVPRGVMGLVGPYRVYGNPNETREYVLQEEELVEETADSASERIQEEGNKDEHRQRARWRIREDDEDTLVPDVRDLEGFEGPFAEKMEDDKRKTGDWKNQRGSMIKLDRSGCVEGILSGKEERAVDAVSTTSMKNKSKWASNEQHEKDSLNETGSTTGGTVEGAPGGGPNRGDRIKDKNDQAHTAQPSTSAAPARSLVSRILARSRSTDDLLDHSEPYSQLWVVLSNVYGELIVVLTLAVCLAEVMDTPVPLMSLQGIFLMYLYVGSIAVIIGIYIWVLVDSCSSLNRAGNGLGDAELGGASLTRFGSLKRAHISRARTAPTSFYIRVGALLFGLATLVFNGLEMAMHSMMQGAECLTDVVFVHPVLHERFGLAARFGFTHLAATNVAVWARLVIWDSAQEWTYFVHLAQHEQQTSVSPLNLRGFPGSLTRQSRDLIEHSTTKDSSFKPYQPVSNEQISQVIALQECLNTNTLGQLWTSSMPFLYPFIVQFSLIAAAVTFVMGQNVGRNRLTKQKFHSSKDLTNHTRIGCDGSSKGLFLGILCMVAGIVVILIFLVVREDENFPSATLSWLTCGTLIGILTLSSLMTASGLVQVRQISVVSRAPAALDTLLSNVSLFGVQLYSVFTIVVCACSLAMSDHEETEDTRARHIMLLSTSILQLVQCFAQSTLIAETSRRTCITRFQMLAKPGRQVITFLLFSNAVLWAFDTVITQNWLSQELQLRFFGVLAWGVLSRIGLPLLIFYRFHSCVLLLEAWNKLLEPATDSGYAYKRLLYPNSLSLDAVHLLPYVDSASWLYLDPNPVFPICLPSAVECDAPCEHHHHHHRHRHHHHHRQRNHQGRHRRVLSDPGGWNAITRTGATRHRRVFSSADLMRASIDEANEEDPSPEEEETRASTFRKVPWHPNLHMLKIRRT
ncbi:Otopetrin-3 [Ooceraea biroi]|uniref:Otopetrin-3 n=1 Tax=Ooceraea biroi TaxID=2015173 RepID=A0A026WSP5_OOCBI|nr:Otopetrin-3 [Ooceraea biroi]